MLISFGVQGSTVEDVCKQLRRLYVVKNFSLEHSVSITCDPSFSAGNEIHVCIVRIFFCRTPPAAHVLGYIGCSSFVVY